MNTNSDDHGGLIGDPYEAVSHPKHYNEHPGGIECIDVIEHMTFNVGSAMKYLWRAGLKPGESYERDMKKAIWYIEREIEKQKKETIPTVPEGKEGQVQVMDAANDKWAWVDPAPTPHPTPTTRNTKP